MTNNNQWDIGMSGKYLLSIFVTKWKSAQSGHDELTKRRFIVYAVQIARIFESSASLLVATLYSLLL